MNRETLAGRVMLLQQNVQIQAQQLESQADNLKMLRGHLAEAQHWLDQCQEPAPDAPPAPTNEEVIEPCSESVEPEAEPCESDSV